MQQYSAVQATFAAQELTLGIDNEMSEGNENDKINKKRPGDLTEYIAWVCRGWGRMITPLYLPCPS